MGSGMPLIFFPFVVSCDHTKLGGLLIFFIENNARVDSWLLKPFLIRITNICSIFCLERLKSDIEGNSSKLLFQQSKNLDLSMVTPPGLGQSIQVMSVIFYPEEQRLPSVLQKRAFLRRVRGYLGCSMLKAESSKETNYSRKLSAAPQTEMTELVRCIENDN